MSLKDQFDPDLDNVFFPSTEFGARYIPSGQTDPVAGLEFEIEENGAPKVFVAPCVWDEQDLQRRMIVQQQGVYMGTVKLFIAKKWFAVSPKAEQLIYTPVNPFKIAWRIVECTDAEECYEIALDKLIT
jgi:hypothetical protein